MNIAATTEETTRMAVEDVRRGVQVQIEQIHADARQGEAESRRQVGEIATKLATLTEQLNKFKPASSEQVEGSQQRISDEMEQRLNLHSVRMDTIHESVQEARKTATENAETLQSMLIGIENLGETVKQMREQFGGWEEPEEQEEFEKEIRNWIH